MANKKDSNVIDIIVPSQLQICMSNNFASATIFFQNSSRKFINFLEDQSAEKKQGKKWRKNATQLVYVSSSSKPVLTVDFPSKKTLGRTVLEGLIAGATAGVTVETALYPIDTIKTRLQVARSGGGINFKGLYSGLSGNIAGVLPASAIFVGVYEPVKQALLSHFPDSYSAAAHLLSGAAGGLAASIIRVPTEVVKQRMQIREFASATAAVSGIVSREGFKGLFAGYGAFLLRDLPFDAIQFAIYEQLKLAGKKTLKRDLHSSEMAVIGALSGAVTGAVTTPLDVIKTRLMVQGATAKYSGVVDCVLKTVAEDGAAAMFRGIGPRVLWIGIGGSIFFSVLEKTKELIAHKSSPSKHVHL